MSQISFLSAPIHIWWDITQQCNFNCRHCYSKAKNQVSDELTTREIFDIIDQLKEMRVGFVYILGGEPLMRQDLPLILEHFKTSDIPLMLNTNGWFVNEDWANRLAQSSVKNLRFSLDGASPKTHDSMRRKPGSFNKVIEGIRLCKKAGVPKISCSYTITKENLKDIRPACELMLNLGVDAVQFSPIAQTGRATEHPELELSANDTATISGIIAECVKDFSDKIHVYSVDGTYDRPLTRLVKKGKIKPDFMGCQAGRTCFCIKWDGEIIPCLLWREPIAGSAKIQPIKEIWDSSELFRTLRKPRGNEHSECKVCSYSNVCARECPLSPSQIEYDMEKRIQAINKLHVKAQNLVPCRTGCFACI